MKGKKSKLLIIKLVLLFIIVALIIIANLGIYGYFTSNKLKTNNINLGYNKIQVNENYVPPLRMEKGISYKKEPYVTNVGNVDCYVRAKSVVSDSRVEPFLEIDYDYDEVHYVYNAEDGYWYYKEPLKENDSTVPLFTKVTIKPEADDIVLDGFDIYVYAESVQVVDGMTMEDTWDYFKNNSDSSQP